ncbi:MAG: hypothetical protein IPL40_11750 [Proteobacteria bacterium]|nr:hypothetical protein [Pseudomonadota bacterium]
MTRIHRRRGLRATLLAAAGLFTALCLAPLPAQALSEEEVLARFHHEPTVQQVQDAAIRYYFVHPDSIRAMRRNAMLKALVPTIGGEFTNSISHVNRELNDGLYQSLPFKESEAVNGDALGWRVQVSWVLDRLMFNPEVLDVQSLIGILDGVVREVTTIYYIRRRLQIDTILRPPPDLAARISQRIRIEELTGLIDAMTGSFMTRSLRRARERQGSGRGPQRRDGAGENVFNSGEGQWPSGK